MGFLSVGGGKKQSQFKANLYRIAFSVLSSADSDKMNKSIWKNKANLPAFGRKFEILISKSEMRRMGTEWQNSCQLYLIYAPVVMELCQVTPIYSLPRPRLGKNGFPPSREWQCGARTNSNWDYGKFQQKKVASFGRFGYNTEYQRFSLEGL